MQNAITIVSTYFQNLRYGTFSYEAVLFVSGKTKANKESYWKNWLDNETEPNRIAYVASTRPRQLLCWALPKLSEEDRKTIGALGMIEYVFN